MAPKQLSARWRDIPPAIRSARMRALAKKRMRNLSTDERRAIGNALVAARKKKHEKNNPARS